MPTDTRRLPVPDESFNPAVFSTQHDECSSSRLINDGHRRKDDRKPEQIRPIFIEAGIISQAKGSAYMELENTKVICAIYGPREVKRREDFSLKGQLSCEMKFATFSCPQRQSHQQNPIEKDYSAVLKEALEPAIRLDKFPKARLDVFLTVLQNDGSALPAAITCASVALADASIEMYDLVIGSSLRQKGNVCLLNPTVSEEYISQVGEASVGNGSMTVGFMPVMQQVSSLYMKGELHKEEVSQAMKKCIDTCHQIYPVVEQCLVKSVRKKLKNKDSET